MKRIHYGSAVSLFATFAYFSLFLFTTSKPERSASKAKRSSNWIYVTCGVVMLACMAWAGFVGITEKSGSSIFLPEAIALLSFAISWLVKGRAGWTLRVAAARGVHYGLHPKQFASAVLRTVRS